MLTMVFDVPASSGGAVTILEYYYNRYKEDKTGNKYIIVLGRYKLEETENIKVLRFPWIKKSWMHRAFFDVFIARKLVKTYKPDYVLSFQNIRVFCSKSIKQTLYMHQSIPFTDISFNPFKDTKYWFIKNVLGKIIKKSIEKCDSVIVQTQWIKDACVKQTRVKQEKVVVEKPDQNKLFSAHYSDPGKSKRRIFYPANANSFKNHIVILKAIKQLKESKKEVPDVIFTISKTMGKYGRYIENEAQKMGLDINFIGRISFEEVQKYYESCILVFPSKLETLGLPLIEAKEAGCPIVCSNLPYAHEVLYDYRNVYYFDPDDYIKLSDIIYLLLVENDNMS